MAVAAAANGLCALLKLTLAWIFCMLVLSATVSWSRSSNNVSLTVKASTKIRSTNWSARNENHLSQEEQTCKWELDGSRKGPVFIYLGTESSEPTSTTAAESRATPASPFPPIRSSCKNTHRLQKQGPKGKLPSGWAFDELWRSGPTSERELPSNLRPWLVWHVGQLDSPVLEPSSALAIWPAVAIAAATFPRILGAQNPSLSYCLWSHLEYLWSTTTIRK